MPSLLALLPQPGEATRGLRCQTKDEGISRAGLPNGSKRGWGNWLVTPRPVTASRALSAAAAAGPGVLSTPGDGGVWGAARHLVHRAMPS